MVPGRARIPPGNFALFIERGQALRIVVGGPVAMGAHRMRGHFRIGIGLEEPAQCLSPFHGWVRHQSIRSFAMITGMRW